MSVLRVCVAVVLAASLHASTGQVINNHKETSNYAKQAISIEYEPLNNTLTNDEGLPLYGTLNGTVTELDDIASTISLNKTQAALSCAAGYMDVKMLFQKDFHGIVYADYDRHSSCKITGNGKPEATIRIPLKGCGSLQRPARVFTNNIVVRFHPRLEFPGDEVITIICRYPPPRVISPPIPLPRLEPIEAIRTLQPLREFEILLILCAIVFLSLMLIGIGCSFYCLKKRNIRVIRRRPASTLGSDVTKMSEPVSIFGGLKIPRAHAEDTSGSEELTESVHSDFPSELMSDASTEDYTSAYSDAPFELAQDTVYPSLHAPPLPGFDIKMAVKKGARAYSPAHSHASSESELVLKAQEQYLTTILERTETNTLETLERIRRVEAAAQGPPPVHARVRVVNNKQMSDTSDMDSESEYSVMTDIQDYYGDKLQLATTEQTNVTVDVKEARMMEDRRKKSSRQGESRIASSGVDNAAFLVDTHTMQTRNQQQSGYQSDYQSENHQQQSGYQSGYQSENQVINQQQQMHHQLRSDSIHQEQHMATSEYSSSAIEKGYTATQDLITPVILERATAHMPSVGQAKNNFDVLIRILDNNVPYNNSANDEDEISSVLTEEERFRLREVIMHDEKISTFLKESYTTEKMMMLKDHRKIEQVIEPQKWDVLIRIIDDKADALSGGTRSESKSSTHKSSMTAQELRSMSEVMVDFSQVRRQDQEARSGYSGISSTLARSTADRSGAEMVTTDYVINREAYFASGEASYETYQK